jgi:hypothetical protein
MNRDAAVNFKRIETQTTFRLPQAIGAKAKKAGQLKTLAQKENGCSPIGPQPSFETKENIARKPFNHVDLKFNPHGELYPSRRKRRSRLPKERRLHVADIGGVVRAVGDIECIDRQREDRSLLLAPEA